MVEKRSLAARAVGPALIALRGKAGGFSQEDAVAVARRQGATLTVGTLGNWERGRAPNLHKMLDYLGALGFTLQDFTEAHKEATEALQASEASMSLEEWKASIEERIREDPDLRRVLGETLRAAEMTEGKLAGNGK